jgi:hypothetical protein
MSMPNPPSDGREDKDRDNREGITPIQLHEDRSDREAGRPVQLRPDLGPLDPDRGPRVPDRPLGPDDERSDRESGEPVQLETGEPAVSERGPLAEPDEGAPDPGAVRER